MQHDVDMRGVARSRRRRFAVSKEPAERTRSVQTSAETTSMRPSETGLKLGWTSPTSGRFRHGGPRVRVARREGRGVERLALVDADERVAGDARRREGAEAGADDAVLDGDAVAEVRLEERDVAERRLRGTRIFKPTSMCASSNDSDQTLSLCFENSTRAIDPSKNQPNRLRFDGAREF